MLRHVQVSRHTDNDRVRNRHMDAMRTGVDTCLFQSGSLFLGRHIQVGMRCEPVRAFGPVGPDDCSKFAQVSSLSARSCEGWTEGQVPTERGLVRGEVALVLLHGEVDGEIGAVVRILWKRMFVRSCLFCALIQRVRTWASSSSGVEYLHSVTTEWLREIGWFTSSLDERCNAELGEHVVRLFRVRARFVRRAT